MNSPSIIFQDSDILILSKPAGMIVNRADTSRGVETLQDWLEKELPITSTAQPDSDFIKRSGIVHRLDKETSGVMIAAKNEKSFVHLQQQFKEGNVSKTYLTLVHGKVTPTDGEVKLPIGRLPWNRMRFGVLPAGRESRTLYHVVWTKKFVEESEDVSFIEVYPKTGRTHQIRVHFQYLHHPLFADELYAGRKTSKKDRKYLSRHFLHAAKIQFVHPTSGEQVVYDSPLPAELSDFVKKLV